jgi:hypothetical protein
VTKERTRDALFAGLVVAVAALAAAQSWARWLDPIIDTGRDLYIPEQIARGAKLYRDIRYQYPPLVPYLVALITSVTGRSLAAYAAIGFAQSAAVAAALWFALRRASGAVAAFVAVLFFVALSFCGASTWGANFIFPYSYAATFGIALILAALALFLHQRNALALAALLVASWCKVEYAVATLLIVIVLAIARRITWRQLAGFAITAAATCAAAAFYFRDTNWLSDNIFSAQLTHGAIAERFFAVVSGRAEWRGHAVEMLVAIMVIVAIAALSKRSERLAAVLIVVFSLAIADHSLFRGLGILQWVLLAYALLRERDSPLLLFALFSVATTLRIPLNVSPAWYGFALVVPVYALAAYLIARTPRPLLLVPMVAILCARDLWLQHDRYAEKQFAIHTPRGTLYDWNRDRARILNAFIAGLPPGTLTVMPEGLTIDYFAQRRTPLTFHTFTPVETADLKVEEAIIRELDTRKPDHVAIVTRDVTEYGSRGFGVDYDQRILLYLKRNYRVEAQWRGAQFGMIVLRR